MDQVRGRLSVPLAASPEVRQLLCTRTPRNSIVTPTSAGAGIPLLTGAHRVLPISQIKRTHCLSLVPIANQAPGGRGRRAGLRADPRSQGPPNEGRLTTLTDFPLGQGPHRGAPCFVEKTAEKPSLSTKQKEPATRQETRGYPILSSSHE